MILTHRNPILVMGLLAAVLTSNGCQSEQFFGPFSLQVPTELNERSTGRTFELPLQESDLQELETLLLCVQNEPDRPVPCLCDYPVLTSAEQKVRMDYQLSHQSGSAATIMVWVGIEDLSAPTPPEDIPDLPWVRVFLEHHHLIGPARKVTASFLEEEMEQVDLNWFFLQNLACEGNPEDYPSPLTLLVGLTLESPEPAQLSMETTLRVRGAGGS